MDVKEAVKIATSLLDHYAENPGSPTPEEAQLVGMLMLKIAPLWWKGEL